MFTIHNSANNITQIDIIGDIGENWWTGEGHTLESVRNQLQNISGDLKVNISSLGGSLIDGLAIYDILRAHNGKVITNIIGATASSGFVIALGGDEVLISENSLLLTHRASSGCYGTADDMRSNADDLERFESRVLNISMKRSAKKKKTEQDVKALMNEERWMTAEEAMNDWGFVDSIYKPTKVLNSADLSKLSNIKPLPENFKQPEMENIDSTQKHSILNLLGFKNDAAIKAENETLRSEIETLKGQITNSTDSATLPLKQEIETLKGEITNKVSAYDALKAEFDALKVSNEANEAEIARLKAGEVEVKSIDPANPTIENNVVPERSPRFQPENQELRNLVKNLNS